MFGTLSESLRDEFTASFPRNGHSTVTLAKVLTAIAALALVYLICRILVFLLKVTSRNNRVRTVNRSKALSLAVSEIGITYGEDIPHAEAIIKAALPGMYERNQDVFEAVPDYMGVENLADSAVVLRFTVSCKEQNVFIARRRLNRELRILFAEKGIEVPFPQVTVWKGDQK